MPLFPVGQCQNIQKSHSNHSNLIPLFLVGQCQNSQRSHSSHSNLIYCSTSQLEACVTCFNNIVLSVVNKEVSPFG